MLAAPEHAYEMTAQEPCNNYATDRVIRTRVEHDGQFRTQKQMKQEHKSPSNEVPQWPCSDNLGRRRLKPLRYAPFEMPRAPDQGVE